MGAEPTYGSIMSRMLNCRSIFLIVSFFCFSITAWAQDLQTPSPPFEFKDGDRVVLLGDALIEREQKYSYLETRIHSRYPDHDLVFRNLGWSGDNPEGRSRVSFDWNKSKEE